MNAIIVADLTYGDAGKGSVVDFLTREKNAKTVVLYTGGAQAAHNVVDSLGRHHTFAQFGSGSLVPGTKTHISRFKLVNPLSMLKEARHLEDIGVNGLLKNTSIERQTLITTPFHQATNRIKEITCC